MRTRHAPCGIPLTWRSVVDDNLDPALIAWCPECRCAVSRADMDGDLRHIPMNVEALADHATLTALATTPRRIS